jgi:soluble P-type ATPase
VSKPGIHIEIPGFGDRTIRTLVSDYTGTLSGGGKLSPGVRERLLRLDPLIDIHVLTSDTFGTVRNEFANVPVAIQVLDGDRHDLKKQDFVQSLDRQSVFALGNGANDRLMLRVVRDGGGIAVAVDNGEGCSTDAIAGANLLIHGAANALDLLLEPRALKAGLRY